jgi:hypothetical protein
VLVEQLNGFQPAMIGTYASALAALTEEQEAADCTFHRWSSPAEVSC